MAAAIVYDGVDGSGGTLFQGMKIFVAQRVPCRSAWIEQVKTNGGEIVLLENLADIMIADHLHKNAPPGSYSWKWIEQSVKTGVLQDREQFQAGPSQGSIRPVGSNQPTRVTRTAFTDADDRALALWVTRAEVQGLSLKGNVIYQQLEQANPRHSYQSWRDRWVKRIQYQPRPSLSASDGAAGPVIERLGPRRSEKSRSMVSNTRYGSHSPSRPNRVSSEASPSSELVDPPTQLSKDQPYTDGDGQLLLDMYDDIMNIDETKLVAAWEAFAVLHPQHTAAEWHQFWMTDIKPIRSSSHRRSAKTASSVSSTESKRRRSPLVSESREKDTVPTVTPKRKERQSSKWPKLRHSAESRFEHTIRAYAEVRDEEVDLCPTIDGQKFKLFDLWKLINKLEFRRIDNTEGKKWLEIASRLGFDNPAHPNAPHGLREINEEILTSFADVRLNFRANARLSLDNENHLSEQFVSDLEFIPPLGYDDEDYIEPDEAEQGEEQDEVHLDIPSSPPEQLRPASAKRENLAVVDQRVAGSSAPGIVTPQKHLRIQKESHRLLEIPSTPEDLLAFQGQAGEPSLIKQQTFSQTQDEVEMDVDEEDSLFIKPSKRDIFLQKEAMAPKKNAIEPETQDFYFSYSVDEGNDASVSEQTLDSFSAAAESIAAVAGSPHEDSSTQSQTDSQRDEIELRAFVDHHIALGYPEEVVTKALLSTTLETGDVAAVMEAIMQGTGIPQNIEGVWTAGDDEAVTLVKNVEEYRRVVAKHGEARCVKRRQFLNDAALGPDSA